VTFVSSTIARRRPNARIGVLCPLFCFQGAVARRHAPIESELVLAGASRTRRFRTLPEGGSVRRRKLYTQPCESCNSVGKIRRICVANLPSQLQGFWPMACCGNERLTQVPATCVILATFVARTVLEARQVGRTDAVSPSDSGGTMRYLRP
jgi:hypothetical protein